MIDEMWTGFKREKTTVCGERWNQVHKMIRLRETMVYGVDAVCFY